MRRPLPAEFPEVQMSFPKGKIRAEFPQGEFRSAQRGVDLHEADQEGKVVLPNGGGTLWLAAIAATMHGVNGKLDTTPQWWHPISGEPIEAEEIGQWGEIEEGRDRFRRKSPKQGTQIKLFFREEGVANLRWMGVSVYDATSFVSQSGRHHLFRQAVEF